MLSRFISSFQPRLALLDETDSGVDIHALQVVSEGVNALRSAERSIVLVTHYQRLLNHVLLHGKAVAWEERSVYRIPPQKLRALLAAGRPTLKQVESFAAEIGIAPGIVVGRLQKDGVYDHKIGNGLKRRLRWTDHSGQA